MKSDKNTENDVSRMPTIYFVRNLTHGTVAAAVFGALIGVCLTLAWCGGTKDIRAWQWAVFGTVALVLTVLPLVYTFRLGRVITDRIAKHEDPQQNDGQLSSESALSDEVSS
jgi:hypothetical protein